ncbi:MAG: efflux RND transporter periplasmic adaptor subunit [Nitrospinae bacterium]|nr:efflux RND transporter periplasmic adaptor subunit [Nitrospinota bacterium]
MGGSKKVLGSVLLLLMVAGIGWIYLSDPKIPFLRNFKSMMGSGEKGLSEKDYEFKKVVRRDIQQTVLATGTVTLHTGAEVKIGARISGKLRRLFVRIGDFIHRGKTIAIIEHQDLLARVAQREAELKSDEAQLAKIVSERPLEIDKAKANIEDLQAQLQLAEKTLARNTGLNKEGFVSDSAVDEAVQKKDTLLAQIKAAREELKLKEVSFPNDVSVVKAQIEKDRANIMDVETQLSYATITAPIDGIVAYVSTQEGETVVAGLSAPTFVTLIDLSKLEVTAYVDETDIGKVKVGQKAAFTVDSYAEKIFKAEAMDIHPKSVIKDNVVNYEVMLRIDKEDIKLLRPDMTANVVVTTGLRPNALAIPKESVKRTADKSFVAVRVDGRVAEKPIETGWREGSFIEVKSGLNEGDEVGVLLKPKTDSGNKGGRPPGRRP